MADAHLHIPPCGAPHDFPEHGDVMGWVVLTTQPDETWQPDWDGLLHPTFEDGQRAVRSASGAGCCVLAEVRRVPVNPTQGSSTV